MLKVKKKTLNVRHFRITVLIAIFMFHLFIGEKYRKRATVLISSAKMLYPQLKILHHQSFHYLSNFLTFPYKTPSALHFDITEFSDIAEV